MPLMYKHESLLWEPFVAAVLGRNQKYSPKSSPRNLLDWRGFGEYGRNGRNFFEVEIILTSSQTANSLDAFAHLNQQHNQFV